MESTSRTGRARSDGYSKMSGRSKRPPALVAFLPIGIAFIAIGISQNSPFIAIGCAFIAIGIAGVAHHRKAALEDPDPDETNND